MEPIEGRSIQFFYDFVCPYAFLASTRIEALAAETGAELVYEPMLLGGVFRAIGAPDSPVRPAAKARLDELDMRRWARKLGVTLVRPEAHPRRTVLALRAAIATGALAKASHALFDAYWREGRDLEDANVVADALTKAGMDGAGAVARASSDDVKADLRARTDEAVRLGIFGAPTLLVRRGEVTELFWGQDRFEHARHMLTGEPWPAPSPREAAETGATLFFHFDFSSPYAYLASTQVRQLARRTGARLVYRPFLLGALFKSIGTPNVPLFAMPAPKQAYMGGELPRWAKRWNVPFLFNSHFPINTVKPLRLVLAAPEARRADLVDVLFRATWELDRDVSKDEVLLEALREAGCDAQATLEASQSEAGKEALRSATASAEALGLCGVPTCIVAGPGKDEADGELFWGQDRLDLVEEALTSKT